MQNIRSKVMQFWLALSVAYLATACGSEAEDYRSRVTAVEHATPFQIAASNWSLRDPGAGGAIPAIAVGPVVATRTTPAAPIFDATAGGVMIGSDCGAMRVANSADRPFFVNSTKGVLFSRPDNYSNPQRLLNRGSAKNMAAIAIEHVESAGTTARSFATSAGGVIYRSDDGGGLWQAVFDAATPDGSALMGTNVAPMGPLAISKNAGPKVVVVGIGRTNAFIENLEAPEDLADGAAHRVLISEDRGTTWTTVDVCPTCSRQAHVLSVAATTDPTLFWVAMREGLFRLRKVSGIWQSVARHTGLPTRDLRSVQASTRQPFDLVVLADGGGVYWTRDAAAVNPAWHDVTGDLPRPGPFFRRTHGKLLRSESAPNELVVMGTKADSRGVYFTADLTRRTAARWVSVVQQRDVIQAVTVAGGWSRMPTHSPAAWRGPVEVGLVEDATGVRSILAAGWSGNFVQAERGPGDRFSVRSLVSKSPSAGRVAGVGQAPLQVSTGVVVDPTDPQKAVFLYADNGFFATQDGGASFAHPKTRWSMGTGASIDGQHWLVAYSVGNDVSHPAGDGGFYRSEDGGSTFADVEMTGWPAGAAPAAAILTNTTRHIYALASGAGVFHFASTNTAGRWSNASQGLGDARDVARLRELALAVDGRGEQFLSAGLGNGSIFLRSTLPGSTYSTWKKLDFLRSGAPAALSFVDHWSAGGRLFVKDRGGQLYVGDLPTSLPSDPRALRAIDLAAIGDVQSRYGVPQAGGTQIDRLLSIDVKDLASCGQWLYAATVDGLWRAPIAAPSSWQSVASIGYRSLRSITAGPAVSGTCRLYIATEFAGGVYSTTVPAR